MGILSFFGPLIGYFSGVSALEILKSNELMIAKNRFFISLLFIWCIYEFIIKKKD